MATQCTACVLRIKCWKLQLWELTQSGRYEGGTNHGGSYWHARRAIKTISAAHFVVWPEDSGEHEIVAMTARLSAGGNAFEDYLKTFSAFRHFSGATEREREAVAKAQQQKCRGEEAVGGEENEGLGYCARCD